MGLDLKLHEGWLLLNTLQCLTLVLFYFFCFIKNINQIKPHGQERWESIHDLAQFNNLNGIEKIYEREELSEILAPDWE